MKLFRVSARHRAGSTTGRKAGRLVAGLAAAGLAAALAPAALADDIYNNLDGSIDATAELITLGVGGNNGVVTLAVNTQNDPGKNGCNLTGKTTLVVGVASSNPAYATVSPSTLTFDSCGATNAVTVHPVAPGLTHITLSLISNSTKGTFNLAPAAFDVNVLSSAPKNTAPTLNLPPSPVVAEATSASGATVSYAVTASDKEDTTAPVPSCVPASGALFPLGDTTVNCSVTDSGGLNTTGSFVVHVQDTTKPVVSLSNTGTLASTGWYNIASSGTGGVVVTVSASDAVGVSSLSCRDNNNPVTLSATNTLTLGDGQHAVACTASDAAGNTGTASQTYKVDQTAPSISRSVSQAANTDGWNNADVTIVYSCSDATSGIDAAGCPAADVVNVEGTTTKTGTVSDVAGNSASVSTTVKLDKTAPTISGAVDSAANDNGWYSHDVTVTFTCNDALSGITSCTPSTTTLGEGANQSVTGNAEDVAGNSSSATVSGINVDETAPVLTFTRTPAANAAGWNNGDVTVNFSCTDALSGVATSTGSVKVTTEGENQSVTGTCTDLAGNTTTLQVTGISIDKTAPVITGSRTPPANQNGWNNGDVTVSFSCDDSGTVQSGIASDTVAGATLSTDGAGQSVTNTGECVDAAGNSAAPATVGNIDIDKTAPTISGVASPAANSYGWNNTDVTVTYTCTDGLSGVDSHSGPDTLSSEGANQSSSGSCTDLAGNTASTTVGGIDIDKTAPTITGSASPAPNSAGWNNTDVTVSYSCTDGLSGVGSTTADQTLGTDGPNQSTSGSCTDKAGNTASTTVSGIDIDKTKPVLAPSVSPNPVVLNGSATAAPNATDKTSGVDSQSCPAVDTSSVGSKSVTCTATDKAGNTGAGSATYSVVYATGGTCLGSAGHAILQPVNADGSSVFKLGSTVPAKFRVCDANGNSIGTAGLVTGFKLVARSTVSGTVTVNEDVTSTTPDTAFRWDPTAQQWIYNISTKGQVSGTKVSYLITLNDGSTIPFSFSLK